MFCHTQVKSKTTAQRKADAVSSETFRDCHRCGCPKQSLLFDVHSFSRKSLFCAIPGPEAIVKSGSSVVFSSGPSGCRSLQDSNRLWRDWRHVRTGCELHSCFPPLGQHVPEPDISFDPDPVHLQP